MIELTEEPYDGGLAEGLIAGLLADLDERYAADLDGLTSEEVAADQAAYLAEVRAEEVRRPVGIFVVAHLDGNPVGCGAVRALDAARRVGEIKRMYTLPTARRRGVSRAILQRLEAVAQELGYRHLQLETGVQQPEAVALYESAGWYRIEPYGHYRASPWSVCLAKELPG
ncbi:MAG: GNAT family N-acetyltransferase [Acidimicrobiales bacterium]|nr:GNAT family N-acetyltransferase [Acidimicrobiales bacterium]